MAAHLDTPRRQHLAQPVQRAGDIGALGVQVLHHPQMVVRIAPCLQRLPYHAFGHLPFRQPVVRQMVVEHDIGQPPVLHALRQIGVEVKQMRLEPELSAQVCNQRIRHLLDRAKDLFGKFIAAQAAFPADELRQHGGGDAIGGQLCLGGDQTLLHGFHRTATGGEVPFEPVPMHIDDPRHDHVTVKINARGLHHIGNQPLRNRQRAGLKRIRTQDLRPRKFNVQHR